MKWLKTNVVSFLQFQVYKRLQSAIYQSPGALSRPPYWNEILQQKAKL